MDNNERTRRKPLEAVFVVNRVVDAEELKKKATKEELQEEISRAKDEEKRLEDEIDVIDDKVTIFNDKINEFDEKIVLFEDRIVEVEEKVTTLDEKVTSLDEDVTEIKEGAIATDERITALDEKIDGVDGKVVALDEKVDEAVENLSRVSLNKLEDYLYEVAFNTDQIDYANALDYFENNYHNRPLGACSSIRKGNWFGRNLDWFYSEEVSFVIKKEASSERFASIGMICGQEPLTREVVESKEWNDYYNLLPFLLSDGINEHGVTVSMNVVPINQKGKTTGTHPDKQGDNICMLMLPSYILDKFKTARDAASWIVRDAKIYAPYGGTKEEELHFLIADKTDTFVVEFVNNEAVLIEGKKFITNFYLKNTTFDENNKVNFDSVTPYGQGLERYNIIAEKYESVNSQNDMLNLLRDLKFTNAYNTEVLRDWWKTDFAFPYADAGYPFPNLTVQMTPQDYAGCGLVNLINERFQNRTRDGVSTWQTVHSAVYDIENKKFILLTQEQDLDKIRTFELFPKAGSGKLIIKQGDSIIGEFSANQQLDTVVNFDAAEVVERVVTLEAKIDDMSQTLSNLNEDYFSSIFSKISARTADGEEADL